MNVFSPLARAFGLLRLSLQRLFSQIGLAACLGLGIAVAVMLASAIPMFSNAVQLRVLQTRIEADEQNTVRPPFAFMMAYYGAINGTVEYEDYLKDDAFQQSKPQILVWEVPERFMTQPLDKAEASFLRDAGLRP